MSQICHCLVSMLVIFLVNGTSLGNDDNVKFKCPGIDGVAVLEEGATLKDICGEDFLFYHFNSDGDSRYLEIFFSSTDDYDPLYSVQLLKADVGGGLGAFEFDNMNTISMNEIPCGTGFLIVTYRDSKNIKVFEDIVRAVKECDNSDIDLELVSHTPITSRVNLFPGNINQQLEKHLNSPLHLGVINHGGKKLRNTTLEGAHMIGFYIRQQNSSMTKHDHCEIPNAIITDKFYDVITFTNSVEPGYMHSFDQHHKNAINMTFDQSDMVCGDAELVIMLDPLKTDNDSNPCNNFFQIPVHVHCNPDKARGNCTIFPNNVMQGHQMYAVFQSQNGWKAYERKSTSPDEWRELDFHGHDQMLGVMGMARQRLGQKMLKKIYTEPDKGLCKWVDKMFEDVDDKDDMENKTLDQTLPSDPVMLGIKSRIQYMKSELSIMSIPKDMENDFKDLEKDIDTINDEMWKQKFHGMNMGLKLSAAYKHAKYGAATTGQIVPDHVLRSTYMTPIAEIAEIMHHYNKAPDYMKNGMVARTIPYIAALNVMRDLLPLPKSVEYRIRRVMKTIQMFIESRTMTPTDMPTDMPPSVPGTSTEIPKITTSPEIPASQFQCPYVMIPELELISPLSMDLYYMIFTTAESEHVSDGDKLAHCHSNIMTTYLKYGGDRMQSKDIVDAFAKMKGYTVPMKDIPKHCRQRLFSPMHVFPLYWKVHNGRLIEGTVSPWTGKMFWKTAAFCHCDKCHRHTAGGSHMNDTMGYGDYTSTNPYGPTHETTTDPYIG